jgi:hypothetical protein
MHATFVVTETVAIHKLMKTDESQLHFKVKAWGHKAATMHRGKKKISCRFNREKKSVVIGALHS